MKAIKALLLIMLLVNCTEQRDLYVVLNPIIRVESDWSGARISPTIMTVMFYATDKDYQLEHTTNNFSDNITLQSHAYNTLIVNGSITNGLDYLRFRGVGRYETFEAYASVSDIDKNGVPTVEEPEILAAITTDKTVGGNSEYFVKYKNGKNGYHIPKAFVADTIRYRPLRLTHTIRVRVQLVNNNHLYARYPVRGKLYGFSGSVFIASRLPSQKAVFNELLLPNNNLPDSESGELVVSFVSFGPPLDLVQEDRRYMVHLTFRLKDGLPYYFSEDVTSQVETLIETIRNRTDYDNELDLEIYLRIEIPKPSGGSITLPPWTDGETENIPI